MMLTQHAMFQPIMHLGSDAMQECNAANTPYKGAWRSSELEGGGLRLLWFLSLSH